MSIVVKKGWNEGGKILWVFKAAHHQIITAGRATNTKSFVSLQVQSF